MDILINESPRKKFNERLLRQAIGVEHDESFDPEHIVPIEINFEQPSNIWN